MKILEKSIEASAMSLLAIIEGKLTMKDFPNLYGAKVSLETAVHNSIRMEYDPGPLKAGELEYIRERVQKEIAPFVDKTKAMILEVIDVELTTLEIHLKSEQIGTTDFVNRLVHVQQSYEKILHYLGEDPLKEKFQNLHSMYEQLAAPEGLLPLDKKIRESMTGNGVLAQAKRLVNTDPF